MKAPFMSYPYTGLGNLLGGITPEKWDALVALCRELAQ